MTQPSTTALRPGEGGFGSLVLISIECKMKSLKLNELGVSALDAKELQTSGGFLPLAVMAVCWGVTATCAAITASLGAGYYNNRK